MGHGGVWASEVPMTPPMTDDAATALLDRDVDLQRVLAIVVGAHVRAEVGDRPSAYGLQRLLAPHARRLGQDPVVLSDVWYLNSPELRARPTISIGGPEVNALTASLADRLPSVHVIDDVLMVQMDLDNPHALACCWGVEPSRTARAVSVFSERYLDAFFSRVRAAA